MTMTNDDLQALRKKRNWMELTVDEYMSIPKDRGDFYNVGDIFRLDDKIAVSGTIRPIGKVNPVIVQEDSDPEASISMEICYIK